MHGRKLDSSGERREHAPVLVLGSASPRRRELLGWLVRHYELETPVVDESPRPGEPAPIFVDRLARAKAAAVGVRRPADWILAADTTVEIEGSILGKPQGGGEATAMLMRLAGREHTVATGFALQAPGGGLFHAEVVISRVRFRPLDPAAIATYVASGEPAGKAGGYAVQGRGAGLIERVEGSLTNVIGLPLGEVRRALAEAGLLDG